jgi:hypothetical protein
MIKVPLTFLNSYFNAFDTGDDLIKNDRHLLNGEELEASSEESSCDRRLSIPLFN